MSRNLYCAEQIIVKLREAEVLESKGSSHLEMGLGQLRPIFLGKATLLLRKPKLFYSSGFQLKKTGLNQ